MHTKIARGVAAALAAGSLGVLTPSGAALASGFALPEVSTAGLGTSNAMVANPKDLGAIPYNPAAMGFHDDGSVQIGALLIGPSFSVENSTGSHDSQGADWLAAPQLQVTAKVGDQWRVGFGVNSPYGLETRWQYGTFPALSQQAQIARGVWVPTGNHPTESKLAVLDFVPSAAFRVSDNLSLAAGLDIYWAKTAQLDSNLGQMSGDGTGVGFNLGVLYRLDALSLGMVYRSASAVGIDGSYAPLNQILVAAHRLQPGQTASVDLDLPWSFQLGARYEVNKDLAVEFDWAYTGWSKFQTLTVKGDANGAVISKDINDWSNSNAYRLGVTYRIRPQTQLRLGYSYDQTGQGDSYFSARIPDSNRNLFSIGIAQGFGNGYSVEAGYMYVMADQRTISSTVPYIGAGANGTSAYNGRYDLTANLIGIEVCKTF